MTRSAFRLPMTTIWPSRIFEQTIYGLDPHLCTEYGGRVTHEPRSDSHASLELDGAGLRTLLDEVSVRLAAHLDSLANQPASASPEQAAAVARSLAGGAIPEVGASLGSVPDLLFGRVFPMAYNTASPGFFGYLAGGGIPHAAVADLIAGVVNRFVGR